MFYYQTLVVNSVIRDSVFELFNNVIWVVIETVSDLDGVIKDLSSALNIIFNDMSSEVMDGSLSFGVGLNFTNNALYKNKN